MKKEIDSRFNVSNKSLVFAKAKRLAVEGVHFARFVRNDLHEYDIGRQVLRSITAPGALIAEATDSESSADMHHKFGVALKECRESQYWIDVLEESNLLHKERWALVQALLNEVTAMLVASRKTLKKQLR